MPHIPSLTPYIITLRKSHVGVVDPTSLKVYGTSNLRVIDASLVPLQIAAHLQTAVYAIAERVGGIFSHWGPQRIADMITRLLTSSNGSCIDLPPAIRKISGVPGGAFRECVNSIVHVVAHISRSTGPGLQRGGVALNAFDDVRSLRANSDYDE